jgi:microcystin-dependent protein
MSTPYLGQITMMAFNFPPRGWAQCDGQLLPINQNQALFSLLGTTYGGNGQTTFALPNLQGRAPVHFGQSIVQGQSAGEATHALTVAEMPEHAHVAQAAVDAGNDASPAGHSWGKQSTAHAYAAPGGTLAPMASDAVADAGGGQGHENMPPYLVINFCIALQGVFPSQP